MSLDKWELEPHELLGSLPTYSIPGTPRDKSCYGAAKGNHHPGQKTLGSTLPEFRHLEKYLVLPSGHLCDKSCTFPPAPRKRTRHRLSLHSFANFPFVMGKMSPKLHISSSPSFPQHPKHFVSAHFQAVTSRSFILLQPHEGPGQEDNPCTSVASSVVVTREHEWPLREEPEARQR